MKFPKWTAAVLITVAVVVAALAASVRPAFAAFPGANGRITFTDGPFTEAKEVIGGYAIYNVGSKKEALEWTRAFLEAHIGLWDQDLEVEIRQMMDDPTKGC